MFSKVLAIGKVKLKPGVNFLHGLNGGGKSKLMEMLDPHAGIAIKSFMLKPIIGFTLSAKYRKAFRQILPRPKRWVGRWPAEKEMGSGAERLLLLLSALQVSEKESLLLFEFPETYLHPMAQQNLSSFFCSQAEEKNLQIVITTHSPYIVGTATDRMIEIK